MSWDRVHAEAEVLEHVLSEELEELIAARLGRPGGRPARRSDPHAPVRDRRAPDTQPRRAAGRYRGTVRSRVRFRPGDAPLPGRARHQRWTLASRSSIASRSVGRCSCASASASIRSAASSPARCGSRPTETSVDPAARPAGSRARGRRRRPNTAPRRGTRGKRARAPTLAREATRDAVHARSRVRGLDRVRRPRQLRDQRAGRRAVRLHPAVGRAGGEPGRDGDPVPVGQARDRHRPQLPRGGARQIPPRVHLRACGCRPRSWRCRPTSRSSSAPRSG